MKDRYWSTLFFSGLALLLIVPAQGYLMDELAITRATEPCNKWNVSFNWSEMDDYVSSVSHADSASGKTTVATDTLTLASASDKTLVLKISITTYSRSDATHANRSSMASLANTTLVKSNVCGEINVIDRQIDGRTGVFASGLKCPLNEPVYVAVYPVEYHRDRPGGVLASNALGLILSTYDQQATERFINSVKIEQVK
jgi:hypothetical protein